MKNEEKETKWIKIAAIATVVIAITPFLKSLSKLQLTIGGFIIIALPLLAAAIMTLYILFADVASLITDLVKKRRASKSNVVTCISGRYAAIISAITLIMTILILSLIKDLPDVKEVNQTVRKVGNKITAKNMASLSSGIDSIIHAIVEYQKDPEETRNRVYEDALRQAADKGYVFYIPQKNYYITAINKRNDKRLLTKEETDIIEKVLKEIFERSSKRDQISLMNMVLSDIRVTEELWKPKKRKVKVSLSELDIIGVVGGYIGELVLKY